LLLFWLELGVSAPWNFKTLAEARQFPEGAIAMPDGSATSPVGRGSRARG
jgi:hypothetical protein